MIDYNENEDFELPSYLQFLEQPEIERTPELIPVVKEFVEPEWYVSNADSHESVMKNLNKLCGAFEKEEDDKSFVKYLNQSC